MLRPGACVLILGLTGALPAAAHHSFSMFDRGKTVTLTGEVKTFQMIAPHGWLNIAAMPSGEAAQLWSLEMGPPGILARAGWTAQSVQPGDAVTVRLHPMRDGSYAGQLMSVKLASGKMLMGGPGRGLSDER